MFKSRFQHITPAQKADCTNPELNPGPAHAKPFLAGTITSRPAAHASLQLSSPEINLALRQPKFSRQGPITLKPAALRSPNHRPPSSSRTRRQLFFPKAESHSVPESGRLTKSELIDADTPTLDGGGGGGGFLMLWSQKQFLCFPGNLTKLITSVHLVVHLIKLVNLLQLLHLLLLGKSGKSD